MTTATKQFDVFVASAQGIFDYTTEQVFRQGGASVSPHGACMYRGANERRCAVGWIIPDAIYGEWMEGASVTDFATDPEIESLAFQVVLVTHGKLLSELQVAHDVCLRTSEGFTEWFWRLRQIAKVFRLNTQVLDRLETGPA